MLAAGVGTDNHMSLGGVPVGVVSVFPNRHYPPRSVPAVRAEPEEVTKEGSSTMDLKELEARIRVLEDIEAIKKLKATYCYLCDAGLTIDKNRD